MDTSPNAINPGDVAKPTDVPNAPRAGTVQRSTGRPGNRRRGRARGSKSGKQRGTLPAENDPIILGRREIAAPLWLDGFTAPEIRPHVNAWLATQHELPVSLDTIYRDHAAIKELWHRHYTSSVDEARTEHIAALQHLKVHCQTAMERAIAAGKSVAPYIDQLRKAEMDIAKLEGCLAPKQLDITSNGRGMFDSLIEALSKPLSQPLALADAGDTSEFEPQSMANPKIVPFHEPS